MGALTLGNPDDPFLNPDMAYAFAGKMDFEERVLNYLYTAYTRIYYNYHHIPAAQEIAQRFSPGVSCHDIDRNFSLVILGNNHVFGYAKPLLPNVIEVHSLQIKDDPGKLPKVLIILLFFFESIQRAFIQKYNCWHLRLAGYSGVFGRCNERRRLLFTRFEFAKPTATSQCFESSFRCFRLPRAKSSLETR